MCVCYQLQMPLKDIAKTFKAKASENLAWEPKEQIRPSLLVPVVQADPATGERVIRIMTWGMPYYDFQKEKLEKFRLFNAKSETVDQKKTFKSHFKKDRILVPVFPSFIEWKDTGEKRKKRYAIGLKSKEPFAFAGIWGKWDLTTEDEKTIREKVEKDPEYKPKKEPFNLYSVITTTPNELVQEIHDRMPCILEPADFDAWLDPENQDTEALKKLLRPLAAAKMVAKAVES